MITILSSRDATLEAKHRADFEELLRTSGKKCEDWAKHDQWWPTTRGKS